MNTKIKIEESLSNTVVKLNKKILFLYASSGSGHQKAAQAIKEALLAQIQDIEMMDIEALKFSHPNLSKAVHHVYMILVTGLSGFYDFLWDNIAIEKRIAWLRKIINEKSLDKFEELFNSFPAQIAVCTQALPCGFLSTLKAKRGFDFKLIAVITDYDVHAYWLYKNVDIYCVPTILAKDKLISRGIPAEKIKITGIPVRLQFGLLKENIEIAKQQIGINHALKSVLIMGGSYGIGPVNQIIENLDKTKEDFTMLVVTGNNKKLYQSLQKEIKKVKKDVKLFGYTEDLAKLMQASDVLITKPGGITVSEALCFGTPMIITRGIRGQESANFNYLTKEGAAIGVNNPADIAKEFINLVRNQARLEAMRKNALRISHPGAAMKVSQLIKSFLKYSPADKTVTPP
ncbi:MAG: glycosyltransferase [Candidatus Omnitrophota bacterium]